MSALRDHVAEAVARKVAAHSVVVWDDPELEYLDSVDGLIPAATVLATYEGSWYDLRKRVEEHLGSATRPRLLVYVPARPPEDDPLAEVRAATGLEQPFRLRLRTAVEQSLARSLSGSRLDEIIDSARNLTEAEELIEQGGGGPLALSRALGTSDSLEMMLRIASGEAGTALADPALRSDAEAFLEQQLGLARGEPDLAIAVGRLIVVAELSRAEVSDAVGVEPLATRHEDRALELLHRWQMDRERLDALRECTTAAATALALSDAGWRPGFASCDSSPVFEELAIAQVVALYGAKEFEAAADLAELRQQSFWSKWDTELPWQARWAVAVALARLRARCADSTPVESNPAALLSLYESETWRVDGEHRRLELALTGLDQLGELEQLVQESRGAFEDWLDGYLRRFTSGVESSGDVAGDLLRQGEVHDQFVAPDVRAGELVAYFLVDALRFELGVELASALRRIFSEDAVRIQAAVSAAPSITPVGMANLCPGANAGLRIDLDSRGKVEVSIDGSTVMAPPARLTLFRATHGEVADIVLDDLISQGESDLRRRIGGAKLVVIRSQEIDQAGEGGKLATAHPSFPLILDHLRRAVAKLSHAGVTRFVISSDHGFIVTSRELGQHRIIDKPGGNGEVHRRAFVGTGGAAGAELIRVSLSSLGIGGNLDVVAPRGLGLIAAGGSRGFFHGGISPQEMLVPVITVRLESVEKTEPFTVSAAISGKVTSRIFTAKVLLKSGLFAVEPLDVGVSAVRVSDGAEVAQLVAAGGAEVAEGVLRLEPDTEALISFQVIADLVKGDRVELRVRDVQNDRSLVKSKPAQVAADVMVEIDLNG